MKKLLSWLYSDDCPDIKPPTDTLDTENQISAKRIVVVDTFSNVTYSLGLGATIDYRAGLNLLGIIASRSFGTGANILFSGPYGWWRETVYRATGTTEESFWLKRAIPDFIAFNTFQTPIYGAVVALSSLVSDGYVDLDKAISGTRELATISPIIAPTLGLYMDCIRRLCGVRTAAQGAYRRQ